MVKFNQNEFGDDQMAGQLKKSSADMTSGSIWRLLLGFAIPTAIGLLFQQFYNTVDTVVVGQFVGKEALAAVGSTGPIINTLVGLCMGLANGAGVIISQCYGAHDDDSLNKAVHTTWAVTFILCLVVTGIGISFVSPMLRLMKTPDDVFALSKEYLTIYFAGITGLLIYNMGSGIMRAVGDSRRPLYFLIISALLNIVFDLVFVIAFDMGVAGVAYATILAQFISAILILIVLTKTKENYGLKWNRIRIDLMMLRKIWNVGFPAGIQQAITSFSNVFVQSYINVFGSACMAGWSTYSKLDVFLVIPVQSIGMASATFVGQNYGAGNMERARKGVNWSVISSLIITASLVAVAVAFRHPLLSFFSTDSEVLYYGATFMLTVTPFYIFFCFNQIYAGALRGIGNAKIPMVVMLLSFVVFRQIYLFFNQQLGGSFIWMGMSYPFGWLLCSLLISISYFRSPLVQGLKKAKN